jgi:hypothetical protein
MSGHYTLLLFEIWFQSIDFGIRGSGVDDYIRLLGDKEPDRKVDRFKFRRLVGLRWWSEFNEQDE